MSKKLVRKARLERLASPEQLDSLMQVNSPVGWLALLSLGFIIVIIVLWSFFGTIPDKVNGQGILTRGVHVVTSETIGLVTEIKVNHDAKIKTGAVIAHISQERMNRKIRHKEQEIAELSERNKEELATLQNNIKAKKRALDEEKRSIEAAIININNRIRTLQERVKRRERGYKQGIISLVKLQETKNELSNEKNKKRDKQVRLKGIISDRKESDRQLQTKAFSHATTLNRKKRELDDLVKTRDTKSKVTSPYDGRIVEINAEVGSLVKVGDRILTIESEKDELKAVCYTPAIAGGKKIKRGMKVQISPSTVKSSDYGFIIGKVQSISHRPVSNDRMRDILKNEKLIEQFTRNGAPFELVVILEQAQTPSGYRWTSSQGPPISVDSGTLCNAFVIVARKRPIEYVIPIFNEIINFFRD